MNKTYIHSYKAIVLNYVRGVDWSLLLFLLLFLNVKLYVKLAAILFGLFVHRQNPLPRGPQLRQWMGFYLAMIVLALVNALLTPAVFTMPGMLATALGLGWWLSALMAAWFIHLFVKESDPDTLHRTAGLFFMLNATVMFVVFLKICINAGTINPYTYLGEHQKYFISTGDLITGVSLDGSVTAALISVLGLFYFLYRGRAFASFFCFVTVLLAGSNFIDLLLVVVFIFIFLFHTDRLQKGMIVLFVSCMFFFAIRISPENGEYALRLLGRVQGQHAYEVPLTLPEPRSIDLIENKAVKEMREELGGLMGVFYTAGTRDSLTHAYRGWDLSGRKIAWQELGAFFRDHPGRLPAGAGMGNFSSRLAFKTAALGVDGNYPLQLRYVHPFFRNNYLFIYLYYHSRDQGQHSLINGVDSVYGQLLSEYGLIGVGCFVFFYAAFFLRPIRRLSYGVPVLIALAIAGFTGYWFEQLSVVVLFEFIMLLDMRNIDVNA